MRRLWRATCSFTVHVAAVIITKSAVQIRQFTARLLSYAHSAWLISGLLAHWTITRKLINGPEQRNLTSYTKMQAYRCTFSLEKSLTREVYPSMLLRIIIFMCNTISISIATISQQYQTVTLPLYTQ